ncbi:MAG: aminotransferase class IV [Myxococcota bacterium]|jgi:branched-subunit amino acid aminotransferase/4-amino-4-deoxychorismate lyase|nr:aminotransferase class IV [Myxococcota bacterium]
MLPLWFDGRIVERGDPCLSVLSDPTERPVCCTAARVRGGRVRHEAAHRARLTRDAMTLGAGRVDDDRLTEAWAQLSEAAFGAAGAEGIIRIEAHPSEDGEAAHLLGTPREVGDEPTTWKAISCPTPHPGPGAHRGAKLVHFPAYEAARAHSASAGVDEGLLFNGIDHVVEGARSNLVVVRSDGSVVTPDPKLGAVRGVGLSVLQGAIAEIKPAAVTRDELRAARELIAVNAVRGARAIVEVDAAPVGDGKPGDWAARLDAVLSDGD